MKDGIGAVWVALDVALPYDVRHFKHIQCLPGISRDHVKSFQKE